MKNGSEINEALENSPDPGMIESLLSPAQREVVQDYKRRQMEEQYAAMTAEVKARFVKFFLLMCLKRKNVSSFIN